MYILYEVKKNVKVVNLWDNEKYMVHVEGTQLLYSKNQSYYCILEYLFTCIQTISNKNWLFLILK